MIDMHSEEYDPAVIELLAVWPDLPKTGSVVGSYQNSVMGQNGYDPLITDMSMRILKTGTRPGSFLAAALTATQSNERRAALGADDLLHAASHTLAAIKQGKVDKSGTAFCWRQLKLAQWELDDHCALKDNAARQQLDADIKAVERAATEFNQKDAPEKVADYPSWLAALVAGATEFHAQQAAFTAVSFVASHYGLPWLSVFRYLTTAVTAAETSDMLRMLSNVYLDMYRTMDGCDIDEWCGIIQPTAPHLSDVVKYMQPA